MSDALSNTKPALAIVPSTRMSDAAYDAERARLRELYGDSSAEAAAKRDQALALLFHRSGWTQEELAKKEGKSQQWVVTRLRFGRFMNFTTTVVKSESLPSNLTERRFRYFWERTEGDERLRFREVAKMLKEPNRLHIGGAIKEHYADGKWHKQEVIAKKLKVDEDHVEQTFITMVKYGSYGVKAEKKKVGTKTEYRLFKKEKTISSHELLAKLTPIIEGLEDQGRKNIATRSIAAVAVLAAQLRKLLNEWA